MLPLVKTFIAPKEKMMPEIEKILYSGYIAIGDAVNQFEKEFGEFIKNPNVVSLNSGTAALHIAMVLMNIGPEDEVISTAMTSEATNIAITMTGAKIVWADVDPENGLISPDSIREKITDRTKAIIVVHYAGMVCDMDRINAISEETGVPVIEDTAHALGSRYMGMPTGSNSRYTCFSFQAIKHMTTVDGGAISFRNEEEVSETKKLRWFGLSKKVSRLENDITRAGYKYGMNNVNATIGSVQLKYMHEVIGSHIANGKFFDEELKNVPGVKLVKYNSHTEPSYWIYTMRVENRDSFIKMMEANNITASLLHHRNDTHTVFKESLCPLPNLDKWYGEFVHIPCGWWLSEEDRSHIVEVIKKGW